MELTVSVELELPFRFGLFRSHASYYNLSFVVILRPHWLTCDPPQNRNLAYVR